MILEGDCRETLKSLAAESVSSIVTDPPYEIGFMGKGWDGSGVANDPDLWAECYRVLKPGGHVMAFGAARTYHRMACAIEDAGFEIRDSIHWVYGSGFPKSHNVSKGIDRKRYDRAEVLEVTAWIRKALAESGRSNAEMLKAFGFNDGSGSISHWTAATIGSQPTVPTLEQVPLLLDLLGHTVETVPPRIGHLLLELNGRKGQPGAAWYDREIIGTNNTTLLAVAPGENRDRPPTVLDITTAATDDARQWEGWGTALKPAHEPIVMARKPFAGTVAQNVLEHGTGAINIDGARIGLADWGQRPERSPNGIYGNGKGTNSTTSEAPSGQGRWPANVILTHSTECGPECTPDCPANEIDRQAETASRYYAQPEWAPGDYLASVYTPKAGKRERNAGLDGMPLVPSAAMVGNLVSESRLAGNGTPIKTPERQNHHPTVKPVALMRYLIRLVTPPGGTVLDPFLGSGTTAVAAILEGFNWIGCELTAEYLPIIEARCANAMSDYPPINTIQNPDNSTESQLGLFEEQNL
jgi:DNA modification methylase